MTLFVPTIMQGEIPREEVTEEITKINANDIQIGDKFSYKDREYSVVSMEVSILMTLVLLMTKNFQMV